MSEQRPKMPCEGCAPETPEMCLACYKELAWWAEERIAELEKELAIYELAREIYTDANASFFEDCIREARARGDETSPT